MREKLPFRERPFQAKHETTRCGKAQQSSRTGLEGGRAGRSQPQSSSFSRAVFSLRQGSAQHSQEHICWCCIRSDADWHHLAAAAPAPAAQCSGRQQRATPSLLQPRGVKDRKESVRFSNSLCTLKASVNEKSSPTWEEQSTQAGARQRTAKGKHCVLTCSRQSLASPRDLTHSSLNASECSLNLFLYSLSCHEVNCTCNTFASVACIRLH